MFAVFNGLFHKIKMRIVRCCNINHINIRVGEHFIVIRIDFADAIFFSKNNCFFMGSIADCINILSILFQSNCHFICNNTCTKYSPVYVLHRYLHNPFMILLLIFYSTMVLIQLIYLPDGEMLILSLFFQTYFSGPYGRIFYNNQC